GSAGRAAAGGARSHEPRPHRDRPGVPPGSAAARAAHPRVHRPRVLARRRAGHPDHSRTGAGAGPREVGQHLRRDRPHGPLLAPDATLQRARPPRALAALRRRPRRPPARHAARRPALRRGDAPAPGPRLRAGHRVASPAAGAAVTPLRRRPLVALLVLWVAGSIAPTGVAAPRPPENGPGAASPPPPRP